MRCERRDPDGAGRSARALLAAALLFATTGAAVAQSPHAPGWAHQWIVPSRAVLPPHTGYGTPPVRVTAARADVHIRDRAATTTRSSTTRLWSTAPKTR